MRHTDIERIFFNPGNKPLPLVIEDEVDAVCDDPEIGELKVGDLAGIRVHKFRFSRQEYLIRENPLGHRRD
ncbi:MAG: type II toxin-antitoxin system RelE/ParE family toxin [Rhodoferax sp.]|nr:type II toxin-antitoxin system RelE/ParE family toxin [Rhodoferax sp.]